MADHLGEQAHLECLLTITHGLRGSWDPLA